MSAVVLSLALAGTASADTLYTASGSLIQTDPGKSSMVLTKHLPGGLPDGILGRLTTDQKFQGKLRSNDWHALRGADVEVFHNSFITFADGVPDFHGGTEAIIGVAYGSFGVRKENKSSFQGEYVIQIQGTLILNPTCPVDPALGVGASVDVVDTGVFEATHRKGAHETIHATGDLVVTATGCIGTEVAAVKVSGIRTEPAR